MHEVKRQISFKNEQDIEKPREKNDQIVLHLGNI